jgi:hypothetical protein
MKELSIVQDFVQSARQPLSEQIARANPGSTAPAPLKAPEAGAAPVSQGQDPAHPSVPVELVSTAGEEFGLGLSAVHQLLHDAVANPRDKLTLLSRCHFVVESMRRKAIALQQMARLGHNRVRQSHEKLNLHEVVDSVLTERKSEHASGGFVVEPRYKPVQIIVDPGLLVNLISAALDWVCEFGNVLRVSTSMKDWPQHGLLMIRASQGVNTQADLARKPSSNESISWHLLQQVAHGMGVGIEADQNAKERSLIISFPRTVVALEGMTMMEMDTANSPLSTRGVPSGQSGFSATSTNFIAGHTVLLLASDARVIAQVREICRNLSLRMEHALSVEKAERACELSVPHMIICEELLADVRFEGLMDDLQRHSPGFPTVLIGEGNFGFEMSGWSGTGRARVSKQELQHQLPTAITMELSRWM